MRSVLFLRNKCLTIKRLESHESGSGRKIATTNEHRYQRVGWVERSETHQFLARKMMGFARALPILRTATARSPTAAAICWSVTSNAYLQATDVDARNKCGHDGPDERVI